MNTKATEKIVGSVRVAVLHDSQDGRTYVQLADAEFAGPVMTDPPADFIVAMVTDAQQANDFLREVKEGMS